MSEKTKISIMPKQRREEALQRRKDLGLLVTNAYSPRHISVMKNRKIVNDNNRVRGTERPDRLRTHTDTESVDRGLKKKVLLLTAGTAAAFGSLVVIDNVQSQDANTPTSIDTPVTLPENTGDSRVDTINTSRNSLDPTSPNQDERLQAEITAKDIQGFQGD